MLDELVTSLARGRPPGAERIFSGPDVNCWARHFLPGSRKMIPPATGAVTRDPSETSFQLPATRFRSGSRPTRRPLPERLVKEEGVEEAQHDQMIASRRNDRREDRQGG